VLLVPLPAVLFVLLAPSLEQASTPEPQPMVDPHKWLVVVVDAVTAWLELTPPPAVAPLVRLAVPGSGPAVQLPPARTALSESLAFCRAKRVTPPVPIALPAKVVLSGVIRQRIVSIASSDSMLLPEPPVPTARLANTRTLYLLPAVPLAFA